MSTNAPETHEAAAPPPQHEAAGGEATTRGESEPDVAVLVIEPRFPLGHLGMTHGAAAALYFAEQSPIEFIARHALLDQGELPDSDHRQNERALKTGQRVFSCFKTEAGETLYVITEADRSSTTILLPSEY